MARQLAWTLVGMGGHRVRRALVGRNADDHGARRAAARGAPDRGPRRRRGRVGARPLLADRRLLSDGRRDRMHVAEAIGAAVRTLARHRQSAVILWDPAVEIDGGVLLDARVSRQLIVTIFLPESLNCLRDGAVVISGDRVERAGVPITWTAAVGRAAELA